MPGYGRRIARLIIEKLMLKRPIYRKTASYGHFGRGEPEFLWKKTDIAEILKEEIKYKLRL